MCTQICNKNTKRVTEIINLVLTTPKEKKMDMKSEIVNKACVYYVLYLKYLMQVKQNVKI